MLGNFTISPSYPSITHVILFRRSSGYTAMLNNMLAMLFITWGDPLHIECKIKNMESVHRWQPGKAISSNQAPSKTQNFSENIFIQFSHKCSQILASLLNSFKKWLNLDSILMLLKQVKKWLFVPFHLKTLKTSNDIVNLSNSHILHGPFYNTSNLIRLSRITGVL